MDFNQISNLIVIPFIITVLGNLIFFKISQKSRMLVWSLKSKSLATYPFNLNRDVDIVFTGGNARYKVKNGLTKVKIIIFNNSKISITGNNIHEPITITFDTCILKYSILANSNDTIKIIKNEYSIDINFDYLKSKEGFVIEVIIDDYFLKRVQINNPLLDGKIIKKPLDAYNTFLKRRKFIGFISPYAKVIVLRIILSLAFLDVLVAPFLLFDSISAFPILLKYDFLLCIIIMIPSLFSFLYKSWNIPLIKKELEIYFNN